MNRVASGVAFVTLAGIVLATGIVSASPRSQRAALPDTMLWAWEHPQDLRFLDPRRAGVAYLALTLRLEEGQIRRSPRRQPLRVAPGTKLVAVARIETGAGPDLGMATIESVARDVRALARGSVVGIQVDFDARRSERAFYRRLAGRVRESLPDSIGLSMTALASWCMDDRWMEGMPVDETVPMLFRMGAPAAAIRHQLANARDFPCAECHESIGLSTDEPAVELATARRVYWFHPGPWSAAALAKVARRP